MRKRKVSERREIHEGSGNVYRDLGFRDAEEMLVKAKLVHKISEIIRAKGLTQMEAAKILGLTQPKLSGPALTAAGSTSGSPGDGRPR